MESYEYINVDTDDIVEDSREGTKKYFLRQAFVFSTLWPIYFVAGMAMGAPTVFIPQLQKEHNSTEFIDESMSSWLSSIFSFAAMPGVIIMPVLANYVGRKIPFVLSTVAMLVGSIVFYCSKNVTQILISEVLSGIVVSSLDAIGSSMIITEYMSPKYRGLFLTFKSATFFWGIWISNAIGSFFNWRYIPLVMIILSIYPAITVYLWPESPYYLAKESKFDACIKSHRWLRGRTKLAEKELSKLLSPHNDSLSEKPILREVIFSKRFYKATLLCSCILALYTFTGKLACAMYSIDIIKKMTSSGRTAYMEMLILDGVTVLSMYIGSMLTRVMRRRTLLFTSTTIGIISLLIMSLYVYLVNISILTESNFVSLVLLSLYSVGISCGPMIMSVTLCGELFPLQYKSLAIGSTSIIDEFVTGVIVKLTPSMIRMMGLHGTFLFFGLCSAGCLWLIYLFMPETKDKTLFEISDAIIGVRGNKHETINENFRVFTDEVTEM